MTNEPRQDRSRVCGRCNGTGAVYGTPRTGRNGYMTAYLNPCVACNGCGRPVSLSDEPEN